jgi:hypothetical protein
MVERSDLAALDMQAMVIHGPDLQDQRRGVCGTFAEVNKFKAGFYDNEHDFTR